MRIEENVLLAPYTTLRVGGPARFFVRTRTVAQLRAALAYARTHDLAVFVLGGGSNIVMPDAGWDGLVIKLELSGRFFEEQEDGTVLLVAQAGEIWDDVVADTVARGLWGIENLSGIPGTVGATPIQNVGAYGVEVKDLIAWVEVFNTQTNGLERLSPEACGFAYRDSLFKHPEGKRYVVIRVAYRLAACGRARLHYKDVAAYFARANVALPTVKEVRDAILAIRGKKFPDSAHVGTAGSFFQNPVISREQYARLQERCAPQRARYGEIPCFPIDEERVKIPIAWFLDKVMRLNGYRRGNVGVYEHHALAIVSYEGAQASEVRSLAHDISDAVKAKTDIIVESEVTFVNNRHALTLSH